MSMLNQNFKEIKTKEMARINWISNSEVGSMLIESSNDKSFIPNDVKLLSDILTSENLLDVISSIRFFGGMPSNFLNYIRSRNLYEFEYLLENKKYNKEEHNFINELKEFNSIENNDLCNWAVKKGKLDILIYSVSKGYYFSKMTTAYAAKYGRLDFLEYLHKNNCPWDYLTISYASQYGNVDCLKYAVKNGCNRDSYSIIYAAKNGNLECLKFLHVSGFSWNEEVTFYSAKNGNLDCFKYALENGCPIDNNILFIAQANVVEYLQSLTLF